MRNVLAKLFLKASAAARGNGVDTFLIATEVEKQSKWQVEIDNHDMQDSVEQHLMTNGHLELAGVYIE